MPVHYPALDKARQVLRATERAVPYNNVSNLFVRNGQRPHPRLGGDCLYQAHVFAERFRAVVDGMPVRIHNHSGEGTDGHVIPIVGDGDERAACEITMLAAEPVVLADVRGRANAKSIPTFPLAPLGNRELKCFWIPQNHELNIGLLSGGRSGLLHHRIATDAAIEMPDHWHPTDEAMCAQPRRPLKLHLLEKDGGKSTLTMDPADGSMEAKRVGAPVAYSGTKRFDDVIHHIAGELGVTRAALLEFFHEGLRMERELQGLD
jgi:hypothetical protein